MREIPFQRTRFTVGAVITGSLLAYSISMLVLGISAPSTLLLVNVANWVIRKTHLDIYPLSLEAPPSEIAIAQLLSGVLILAFAIGTAWWLFDDSRPA